MGLMLDAANPTFLDNVGSFFTQSLTWGTELFKWVVSTEPVNYFVGISLIVAVIAIIKRVKRG